MKNYIEFLNESITMDAVYIHQITGCGQNAAQYFIDDNNIDAKKLVDYVKKHKDSKEKYDIRDLIKDPKSNKKLLMQFVNESISEDVNFPAAHGVGDNVQYVTGEGEETRYGTVARVSFTKAKVWYDILDDVMGEVIEEIDSVFVSKIEQKELPEAPKDEMAVTAVIP